MYETHSSVQVNRHCGTRGASPTGTAERRPSSGGAKAPWLRLARLFQWGDKSLRAAEPATFDGPAGLALDAISDWVCNLDAEGRILCANFPMVRDFWREQGHLPGAFLSDLAPPEAREAMAMAWQGAISTGTTRTCEHEFKTAGRAAGWCQWTFQRLPAGTSGTAAVAIGRDITELRLLERQLLHAQRLGSIGTLASGIAHDLGNVLAPLVMSAELLKVRDDSEKNRALLEVMASSARRGAGLVRQVLLLSRNAENGAELVDLNHLVAEVGRLASATFASNIKVRTEPAGELWPVRADPTQIHQVLLNLCVNAREAMPHGGELCLATANLALDEASAHALPGGAPGRYAVLGATDTGMGIAPEIAGRIFDPFFTTKPAGESSGLGLSTARSIVRACGGFITFTTEVGRGSAFNVYLPAAGALAGVATDQPEPAPPRGNGERVLVVDDEEIFRDVSRRVLEAFGYVVHTAANGAEAVRALKREGEAFAAVLIDLNMPVMDGWSTIRACKAINPLVRLIAVSGLGDSSAPFAGEEVALRLTKPFSMATLLRGLRQVLTQPAAPALRTG
ncbi:MAG: hypothetical protein A3G75_04480 [Verrucomicrobia bacterium RIFCSPLOWO2_12_FULL_64_8]|nr:MAG: hypothetical protein A3G75_04480 [Verrucomicrobia bacterium RIFCSPLOWO2_12_FULL_64_8]